MSSIYGRDRDFSLLHVIQTSYVAHPASYPVGTRGSSLGGSGQDTDLTTHLHLVAKVNKYTQIYLQSPICPWYYGA
jgi:hypothetical protein